MSGTAEALTPAGIVALGAIVGWWLGRRKGKRAEVRRVASEESAQGIRQRDD